jgi:hypothetical protein
MRRSLEKVQMTGQFGGDRIKIQIPYGARAKRRGHGKHDAAARLWLKAKFLSEALRSLRAITDILVASSVQRVRVKLVVGKK